MLAEQQEFTSVAIQTIYNYVHNGVFLNLTNEDLPYRKHTVKRSQLVHRPSYHRLGARTIEDRSKSVYKRDMFGHWEMDTVYSGKDTTKEALLVLTERATRMEKIFKIENRKAETVLNTLNRYERKIGYRKFRNTFKTITCDNGTEFAKYKELELSQGIGKNRTLIYFCHPYCSGERGSNENANKLIRRFIPKGADISNYTHSDIQYIEDWINNYPRKLFNGKSSNAVKSLLKIP